MSGDTVHDFEQRLASRWDPLDWRSVTVVLAVSGGPDSVALLRGMRTLAGSTADHLVVGHFNHRLRGEQADADERFVRQLAEQLGVAFQAGQAEFPARPGGDGLEAAARAQRYGFLRGLADRMGAR
ncbi:MAG: hypothetical protein FJ276_28010, partial [Planctomycetes bacterium]|nr:hypothetical protein [Planctomycetota bacterium]